MNSFFGLASIAVICGIAVALQSQFMGVLENKMGTLEGVFVTFFSGGLVAALIMLFVRGNNLKAWPEVPLYAFTTGILGLIIVGSIGYVAPRIGLTKAFTIIVATQFIIAIIIDHFGLMGASVRPMDMSKVIGVSSLLAGVWLIIK
jgi:transporter family-2 protein